MFWQKIKKPILALAPMAGITDSAFRFVCKKFGADVVYSEMISATAIFYKNEKTLEMLKHQKKENPLVIQVFGNDPEHFAYAAKVVSKHQVQGIDINFGCPVRKVFKQNAGASLMLDLDLCYEIIKSVIKSTKLPVSVKIRSGIKKVSALDFIKKINPLPVAALMMHGRTYEQGFAGPVDFDLMKKCAAKFNGIFLANGGVNTPEQAEQMLKATKADGLGLARGILGKPWLFQQIKDYLNGQEFQELDFKQIKKVIFDHLKKVPNNHQSILEFRKHLGWYVKGFAQASKLRRELMKVESKEDIVRCSEIN